MPSSSSRHKSWSACVRDCSMQSRANTKPLQGAGYWRNIRESCWRSRRGGGGGWIPHCTHRFSIQLPDLAIAFVACIVCCSQVGFSFSFTNYVDLKSGAMAESL